jgi:c-di-GMP-binding flagellar brake protein YcgR
LKYNSSSPENLAQKRETFRIELGLGNVPIVEFPESVVGEHCFFRVVDLSEGGLSFEHAEKVETLQAGVAISHCYLEFNAIDRVRLTITFRHAQEVQSEGHSMWRYGCSFDGLSAEDERLVRRTIQARERRHAQTRSRFA